MNEERIKIAEFLGKPDQVPVAPHVSGSFISHFVGIRQKDYYSSPRTMLHAQLEVCERFHGFFMPFPDFSPVTEISAIGSEIVFPEDDSPWPKQALIRRPEDIEKLQVPDPYNDGLMAKAISYYRYMSENFKKDVPVGFYGTLGPFDIASLLRGPTEFMLDLYRNREFAHKLLKLTAETCIVWLKVQEEVAGQPERVKIADDFPGFLSPKMFREFVLPYTKMIFEKQKRTVVRWWHSDADRAGSIIDFLPEMGVQVFYRFHPSVDIREAKEKIGNKVCLAGNVPPLDVMLRGTCADVERACRTCLEKGASKGGFILAPGGEIIRGTPAQNIDTFLISPEKYEPNL